MQSVIHQRCHFSFTNIIVPSSIDKVSTIRSFIQLFTPHAKKRNTNLMSQKAAHNILVKFTPGIERSIKLSTYFFLKLKRSWFFDCTCQRCSDPTEFGTFISSPKCFQCSMGLLCPVQPLDHSTDWKCQECGNLLTRDDILQVPHFFTFFNGNFGHFLLKPTRVFQKMNFS